MADRRRIFLENRAQRAAVSFREIERFPYETQSDEEAVAGDEAAYESTTHTAMEIPVELVPQVRELLAKRRAG